MDYISNKALIIAVSLLITMGIASAVLYTINQVTGIYKTVYETDTLIQSNFDEFDAYNDVEKTKLDLLNAAKKYKDSSTVYVTTKKQSDVNLANVNEVKNNRINQTDYITSLNNELGVTENFNDANLSVDVKEASKKYKTYVKKLDNIVVIGFIAQ